LFLICLQIFIKVQRYIFFSTERKIFNIICYESRFRREFPTNKATMILFFYLYSRLSVMVTSWQENE
jgi:hypothetical protein